MGGSYTSIMLTFLRWILLELFAVIVSYYLATADQSCVSCLLTWWISTGTFFFSFYFFYFFNFAPLLLSTEGVQLLCLIDKGLDACRYLQTYGEWDRAAWLAKVAHGLSQHQCLILYFNASIGTLTTPLFL